MSKAQTLRGRSTKIFIQQGNVPYRAPLRYYPAQHLTNMACRGRDLTICVSPKHDYKRQDKNKNSNIITVSAVNHGALDSTTTGSIISSYAAAGIDVVKVSFTPRRRDVCYI